MDVDIYCLAKMIYNIVCGNKCPKGQIGDKSGLPKDCSNGQIEDIPGLPKVLNEILKQ